MSSVISTFPAGAVVFLATLGAALLDPQVGLADDPQPIRQPRGYTVDEYSNTIYKQGLAPTRPNEVELDGVRRVTIPTSMGSVDIRFNRSISELFGPNPDKIIGEAWTAAARALAQNSFPSKLRSNTYPWKAVVMDDVPAGVDIDARMAGACHPAWMRPPADIFVAAKRVANQCGRTTLSKSEASRELRQSLIHELGHAIEFEFMGRGFAFSQRWHSEGFARWFESLATEYLVGRSKFTSKRDIEVHARAVYDPRWRPSAFRGSSDDYARAYALIAAIAEGKSISRLSEVYAAMGSDNLMLVSAVQKVLGWNEEQWVKQAGDYLRTK